LVASPSNFPGDDPTNRLIGIGALSAREVAAGFPFGSVASASAVRIPVDPWAALEKATLPALSQPPAVVAFSGGRDSSLILAAAVSAARRHGLPEPVPVTLQFAPPATNERTWQELVVRFLKIGDWEILDLEDDLDLLGDIAQQRLQRHGLTYPTNAHSLVPIIKRATNGTLMTGIGGDDLFASWRWRRRSGFLSGAGGCRPESIGTTVLGSLPAVVRRRILSERVRHDHQRGPLALSWLTDAGRQAILPDVVEAEDEPTNWQEFLPWVCARRNTVSATAAAAELAEDHGVQAFAPLLDTDFVAAMGVAGGKWGFHDRTAAMGAVAGEALPPETVERGTKAHFHDIFWGPRAREFARSWDGTGVDNTLIDSAALRRQWLSPRPDFRSTLLLHDAWLAAHGPAIQAAQSA
jgi:hypothetical protein